MAIQIQGNNGVTADVGGTGFRALKVQPMPLEFGSLGIYRKSLLSGTMGAGAGGDSPIWSMRWTDTTNLCAVKSVSLDGFGAATGFTAGFANFRLYPARSYSAVDSGGTAGTKTGNNGKLRTSMGTTLINDMRISSTAALTAGTRTLDTDAIGVYALSLPTTANIQHIAVPVQLLGVLPAPFFHPCVLAANEGLVLQATVPATGTWQFGVTCSWAEVAAF